MKEDSARYSISIQDMFLFTLAMGGYFFALENQDLWMGDEIFEFGIAVVIGSTIMSFTVIQFLNRASFRRVWIIYLTFQPTVLGIVGLADWGWLIGLGYTVVCIAIAGLVYRRRKSLWTIWLVNTALLLIPGATVMTNSPAGAPGFGFFLFCTTFSTGIYFIVILFIPFLFCRYIRDGKNFLKAIDSGTTKTPLPESSGKPALGPLDRESEQE